MKEIFGDDYMTNLVKVFFIIVYIALVAALGIYYPVMLDLHPNDAVDFVTTICQIALFSTPIFGIGISMLKLDKKRKWEAFSGVVICLFAMLIFRFLGLGLLGRL